MVIISKGDDIKPYWSDNFTICINQPSKDFDFKANCLKTILYSMDSLLPTIFLNTESILLWSSDSNGKSPAKINTAEFAVRVGRYWICFNSWI